GAGLPVIPSGEYGCGGQTFTPSEWSADTFSVPNVRYYQDEGYLFQAEATNTSNPLSWAQGMGLSYDGGAAGGVGLLSSSANLGWQTISYSDPVGPDISYGLTMLNSIGCGAPTIAPIGVVFRYIFWTNFLGSMGFPWSYGGSNAAVPGLCQCGQLAGDP